ncbi:DUF3168 domain-containing protein [Acidobacteria bacterium AH-259-A15]|nr:DUF3168 domain-containing protein [Acidobacteria bacterium AH-259-A15]
MTDHMAALVAAAKADAGISALVSTRVFGGELPKAETPSMPRKSLVVKFAGGGFGPGSADYLQLIEFRLDALSYGETFFQADRVRRATHAFFKNLQRQVQGDTLIHRCNVSGGPISFRDPDTDWAVIFESYDVLVAEEAVV